MKCPDCGHPDTSHNDAGCFHDDGTPCFCRTSGEQIRFPEQYGKAMIVRTDLGMGGPNTIDLTLNPVIKIFCGWTLDDLDNNVWNAECGGAWQLETDDPKGNGMNFCPFCGRAIVQMPGAESDTFDEDDDPNICSLGHDMRG